jgi:hypothetical protein
MCFLGGKPRKKIMSNNNGSVVQLSEAREIEKRRAEGLR